MKKIDACFKISFTEEQLMDAKRYVEDMKKHPRRVYWIGKENKSDEELIYSQIVHRILSGFYNNKNPHFSNQYILEMNNNTTDN